MYCTLFSSFDCIHAGGVKEMQTFVNEETVQFGMLKVRLGHGSFARTRIVFVTVSSWHFPSFHYAPLCPFAHRRFLVDIA